MALSAGQLQQLWINAGGDAKYAGVMAKIAQRESRGNPGAQNLNAGTGDHSIGLWQINQLAWKGQFGSDRQLMNPMANAKAAVAVMRKQGPTAWSTYNPAVDAKYIGQLPKGGNAAPAPGGTRSATRTTPGIDNSRARRDLIAQFVMNGGADNPNAVVGLATGLKGAQDTPSSSKVVRVTTPGQPATPTATTTTGGLTNFDGKPVAGWIADALKYARQHGWTGTVASGYRTDAQQTQIYKSGVRPAALPQSMGGHGSNHEFTSFPGGAVDVTNAQQLSQILQRSPYANKLVWAGGKDPVHFSHPHSGGY